jgi:pseudouridine-5'-phosphate glycosidase/pseudouridine kinase
MFCVSEYSDYSEPTSIIKSSRILHSVASTLATDKSGRSPITFASPNLLEIQQMYQQAEASPLALTSHPTWWATLDKFSLGSAWRMDLDRLARRAACDVDAAKGDLSFLTQQGIAQMAVNVRPFLGSHSLTL